MSAIRIIDHDQFKVSPNDTTRKYRHVTIIENQLECLLVSDSSTDKSAACCDIHVGAMSDPVVAQGLAHFLEHMLFMGTKTYPDENAYQAYLSSHGGSSNAYTDQENTVYYFDVLPDYFEGALKIFSSFFVCPLFNESSTLREINAVDSENSKNLQSDMWRTWQLYKSMAKPSHPFSSFSTGNLNTLKENTEANGLNIRDLLLSFYDQFYSANLMKVCVYGKEDLDTLQKWVIDMFSKVPNKNLQRPTVSPDPFGPEQLGKIVNMVPIRDSKVLELAFQLPSVEKYYESKPEKYLSHLFGHESEGSILSALKVKGWANSLSSGISQSYKDFSFLNVDIDLSEEGSHHTDEIISYVFKYVTMLKQQGVQEWIAKEIKDISDMNYRFLQKSQPTSYVMKLASGMQIYRPEHVISSPHIIEVVDISMIPELLSYVRPDNLLVLYKNKSVKTTKKEKWYQTDYDDYKFTEEQVSVWNSILSQPYSSKDSEIFLPKPNPFIPTDFEIRCTRSGITVTDPDTTIDLLNQVTNGLILDKSIYTLSEVMETASKTNETIEKNKEEEEEEEDDNKDDDPDQEDDSNTSGSSSQPMQLHSGKVIQTWFKMDSKWKVPILNVVVILETCLATSTPLAVAMTDLLVQVLKEALNEFAYYADCAGLQYDIQLSKGGIELLFFGYQDKLSVLVIKAIEELKALSTPTVKIEAVFNRMKEKVLRTFYNTKFWQPYYHAVMGSSLCLEDPRWTAVDKQRALTTVTFEDFRCFCRQFTQSLKVEVLLHGNSTMDEAKDFSDSIVKSLDHLPLSSSQEPLRRVVEVMSGMTYIYRQHAKHFNPAEVNSAIDMIYFIGGVIGAGSVFDITNITEGPIYQEALLHLLVQMISDKAFDQLRTKEQLGYIVFTGIKKLGQYIGLHIVVQSNHKDPSFLDDRVESFLQGFMNDLTNPSISDDSGQPSTYIDDKAIEEFKQATIEKLLEQPKNITEETQAIMEEIRLNTYLFDRKQTLASYLQNKEVGNRQMIIDFLQKYVMNHESRRKFSSYFYGGKCLIQESSKKEKTVIIDDAAIFKRGMNLLPSVSYDQSFKSIF